MHDNLPLHYAVEKGCSDVGVLGALVESCPESAEVPSKDGETPIMISFRRAILQAGGSSSSATSFPSEREVSILAESTGEALLTEDSKLDGQILLHQAVRRGAPLGILKLLVDACPASATVPSKDGTGHNALMMSFTRGHDDAVFPSAPEVSLLAGAAGGEPALVTDASGKICLHRAVEDGAPLNVLRALVDANPKSLSILTPNGDNAFALAFQRAGATGGYPTREEILVLAGKPSDEVALLKNTDDKTCLHRILESGKNVPADIVAAIVEVAPKVIEIRDCDGNTPLRLVVQNGPSVDTVRALVDNADPTDANIADCLQDCIEKRSSIEVLHLLTNKCPQAVDKPGSEGRTPLLMAIEENASTEIVKALLESAPSPSNVARCFRHGIEAGISTEVVLLLVDAMPLGTIVAEREGDTVLHYVIRHGASFDIMEGIVDSSPASVNAKNKKGETPFGLRISMAEQQVSSFPSVAEVSLLSTSGNSEASDDSTLDADGNNAIHRGIIMGASDHVLQALVESSPFGLTENNKRGQVPLMLLIDRKMKEKSAFPSADEVEMLLDSDGIAACATDAKGRNALHLAVQMNAAVDVLEALVESSPECCLALNKDGQTPLHTKISHLAIEGKSFGVHQLRGLVDSEGQALLVQDGEGMVALHLAMASGAPIATLEALLHSAPSSIQIRDGRGRLALHHAVANGAIDFVHLLIKEYPESLLEQDKMGLTPLNIALQSNSGAQPSQEVLNQLLGDEKAAKNIATLPDVDGKLPLHSACQKLELVPPEVILQLIELNPKSPSIKTTSGELPIDLVESKRKSITYAEDVEYLNSVSDLLFSFHPNVLPYRTDLDRLQRMRSRILTDLSTGGALSDESRRLWIWLCTIPDRNDAKMHYRNTIESIMKSVDNVEKKKILRNIEIDVPGSGRAPLHKCVSERIILLLAPPQNNVKKCLEDVGKSIRQSHSRGFIHGNVSSFRISRKMEGGYELSSNVSASNTQIGDFLGSSSSLLSTGGISPTMIASLDFEGFVKYRKYWKTVSDDAETQQIVNQLDIAQLTDKIQLYLPKKSPKEATLGDLLGRISSNSKLWEKIKPRRNGTKVYVIKCFHENPATGFPLAPGRLPYELVQASGGHDLWSFGLVLHESLVGSPLIAVDASNNLASGAQYASLYQWTEYGHHIAQAGGEAVKDPVAADLVHRLLHPDTYTSSTLIDRILEHPFFSSSNSVVARKLCLGILASEKERRETERMEAEEKKRQEEKERDVEKTKLWMAQRTEALETVSIKTRVKFEASTWKQWGVAGESLLPTSFVLLPYRLETSAGGHLSVSPNDVKAAQQLGSSLAGILRYVQLLTDMTSGQYRNKRNPTSNAIWRYNELNKHIEVAETTFLGCCRDIVARVDNAKDLLCSLLPSEDDQVLTETASLLIHTHIKSIVDLDECRDIVNKAEAANAAMQMLVASSGGKSTKSVQQVMGEQFDELLGVTSLREKQAEKKHAVEQALTKLVKSFSEDALGTVEKLLGQRVAGLCSTYMSSRSCYLYLVDEFTGFPAKEPAFLSSTTYPLSIDTSAPDDLTVLIPCMLPTLKEACHLNTVTGLASLLGLQMEQIPSTWSEVMSVSPGDLGNNSKRECELLHSIVSCGEVPSKINRGDETSLLQKYSDILLSHDVRRDFGGMTRIRSPGGDFLWSSEIRGDVEHDLERAEILDFVEAARAEKAEKAKTIMEGSASLSQRDSIDASQRSVYERVFRDAKTAPAVSATPEPKSMTSIETTVLSPRRMEAVENRRKSRAIAPSIDAKIEEKDSEPSENENTRVQPPTPGRMFKQSMISKGKRAFKTSTTFY